jgi:hypothetical protein
MSRPDSRAGVGLRTAAALLALVLAASVLLAFSDTLSDVLTRRSVETLKAVIAACAAALMFLDAALRRRGRSDRWRGPRDVGLAVLAVASALGFWNFLQLHYDHWVHYSDTYHYFVGSKYFPELGYTRLYACAAVADAEAAPERIAPDRTLRDLGTNRLLTMAEVLEGAAACRARFSAARWADFAGDIAWFRGKVPPARWAAMQRDHGYNPPPAWGLLGGSLANLGPAGDGRILALTLLDPLLLAVMWGCVAWAFGWRSLCAAVIFWGTNLFGDFGWNGGSFLRQSWLASAVIGICCLRRSRPATGGFLLGVAALLRIFPGVILVALGLRALWSLRQGGSIAPAHRRIAAGALAALGLIVPLSALHAGGVGAWGDFVENSRLHLATPLKNHVGLRTVLAFDAEAVDRRLRDGTASERYDAWSAARTAQFERRRAAYWLAVAAFVGLLAVSLRHRSDWVAAILGVGLIPIAFELTQYYYVILLVYGLSSRRWPAVGGMLCSVAALGWVIVDRWQWQDEIMTWCSVVVVAFVLFCTETARRDGAAADG